MRREAEVLLQVKELFVHGPTCADGRASGMICAAAMSSVGAAPVIKFVQYGTKELVELEPRAGQMFVDVTPPLHRWREWIPFRPIVLDHHKTAREATLGLGGMFGGPDECGATLAYKHVYVPVAGSDPTMSEVSRLSGIRDNWVTKSSDWNEACALAMSLMWEDKSSLIEAAKSGTVSLEALLSRGRPLYAAEVRKNRKYALGAHRREIVKDGKAYSVGFFNCTEPMSDPAHAVLLDGYDFVAGFFLADEDGGPKVIVSLRSGGDVDVSKIAKFHSGGGHEAAAGFRMSDGHAVTLTAIVEAVEAGIGGS